MQRNTENMAKGAAMGIAAGAAMGAAGAYLMHTHPKEVKKMMKKASKTAQKTMANVDKMMQSR